MALISTGSSPVRLWKSTAEDIELDDEAPMFQGMRLELYQTINRSLYETYMLFPVMSKQLADSHVQGKETSVKLLAEDKSRTMYMLMHSIYPDMLKSLVQNTVAYDALSGLRQGEVAPETYQPTAAGAYVVAHSIKGREGKWLSGKEIEKLIALVERYIKAYDLCRDQSGTKSSADNQILSWAKDIDKTYGRRDNGSALPRWVDNPLAKQAAHDFITSLTRRCSKSGQDKSKYHVQSPLYVGCSQNMMQQRYKNDDPATNKTMRHTNSLNGLLCSITTSSKGLNLPLKVVARPVVVVWDHSQLSAAEVLVAALAGSYVHTGGLNTTGAGTHDGTENQDILNAGAALAISSPELPYFQNLDRTNKELKRRKWYIEAVESMCNFGPLRELEILNAQAMEIKISSARLVRRAIEEGEAVLQKLKKQLTEQKMAYLRERMFIILSNPDLFQRLIINGELEQETRDLLREWHIEHGFYSREEESNTGQDDNTGQDNSPESNDNAEPSD